MKPIFSGFSAEFNEIKRSGLYRQRRKVSSAQGVHIVVDGLRCLNFSSNDYLGLANHPDVIKAYKHAADKYGVGSGSAHLICGHNVAHHALEEELADFLDRQRTLLFSTGYMANLGVLSTLLTKGDAVLEDRLNHASLLDGGLLSGARLQRYQHHDIDHLNRLLLNSHANQQLIVTDGVFSMDGDLAPLPELSAAARNYHAWLMVDDAHGIGVLGHHGAGLTEHFQLTENDIPILVGTMGKAMGTFGAFVAGSEELVEMLIQKARTYIYTTALPPAVAEATRASLKLIRTQSWQRDKLKNLVLRFKSGVRQLGLDSLDSNTPIQAILIGENHKTLAVSQQLLDAGIWVTAIRPPTVPKGSARLRITFSAMHEEQHIDQLLNALEKFNT